MNIVSRSLLAASAFKLTGLAALNAEASIIATTLLAPVVINNNEILFDLDGDGTADLTFLHYSEISTNDGLVNAIGRADASVGVVSDPSASSLTLPVANGSLIDASASYKSSSPLAFNFDGSARNGNIGYWANGGAGPASWPGADQGFRGYLGFAFADAASATHYAWADVGTKAYDPADLASYEITLFGYAYETGADQGIGAGAGAQLPEPSSLALLAIGAAGLLARKRKVSAPAV